MKKCNKTTKPYCWNFWLLCLWLCDHKVSLKECLYWIYFLCILFGDGFTWELCLLFPGIPSAPTAITLCVSLSQMDTIQGFRWGTVTRVRLTLQMKRSPFHSDFLDNKEWERIGKKITEYLAMTEVFLKKMLLWTFSSEKFLPTCKRCWVDRMVTWTPSELDDVLPEL